MMTSTSTTLSQIFHNLSIPRPKVFVSYHHRNDQVYADRFDQIFHRHYQVVTDRSLDRMIDSDNSEYVYRRIRDKHITGTSCTIVLCGAQTMNRKFVDWEIKATLDKGHALLGVILPTCPRDLLGRFQVPKRLAANVASEYASWTHWSESPQEMIAYINDARSRSERRLQILNSAPMMSRNR